MPQCTLMKKARSNPEAMPKSQMTPPTSNMPNLTARRLATRLSMVNQLLSRSPGYDSPPLARLLLNKLYPRLMNL